MGNQKHRHPYLFTRLRLPPTCYCLSQDSLLIESICSTLIGPKNQSEFKHPESNHKAHTLSVAMYQLTKPLFDGQPSQGCISQHLASACDEPIYSKHSQGAVASWRPQIHRPNFPFSRSYSGFLSRSSSHVKVIVGDIPVPLHMPSAISREQYKTVPAMKIDIYSQTRLLPIYGYPRFV